MNKHLPLDFFELALQLGLKVAGECSQEFLGWQIQSKSLQLQHSIKKQRAGWGGHPCPAGLHMEECLSTARVKKCSEMWSCPSPTLCYVRAIVSFSFQNSVAVANAGVKRVFPEIIEICYYKMCLMVLFFFISLPLWGKKNPSRLYLETKIYQVTH